MGIEKTDTSDAYVTKRKHYKLDDYKEVSKPFPSNIFILNEIELASIDLNFYKIRNSIWWNSYGYYFIKNIYRPGSCDDAFLFLKIAWKFDLLAVIFMCFDSFSQIQMYTFNPFTNYAPKPWKQIQTYHQTAIHLLCLNSCTKMVKAFLFIAGNFFFFFFFTKTYFFLLYFRIKIRLRSFGIWKDIIPRWLSN